MQQHSNEEELCRLSASLFRLLPLISQHCYQQKRWKMLSLNDKQMLNELTIADRPNPEN